MNVVASADGYVVGEEFGVDRLPVKCWQEPGLWREGVYGTLRLRLLRCRLLCQWLNGLCIEINASRACYKLGLRVTSLAVMRMAKAM